MRLFTAIELTDEARASIAAEQRRLGARFDEGANAPRFVRAEHLHLTLVFIGETPENRAAALAELMVEDIPLSAFQLVLGGVGLFPLRGAPRVLWLGVLSGAKATIDLQAHVAGRLASGGVTIERRPFSPHLTLARWRDRTRHVRPRLPGDSRAIAQIDVESVALLQSRLSSAGPTYTALARAHLRCP